MTTSTQVIESTLQIAKEIETRCNDTVIKFKSPVVQAKDFFILAIEIQKLMIIIEKNDETKKIFESHYGKEDNAIPTILTDKNISDAQKEFNQIFGYIKAGNNYDNSGFEDRFPVFAKMLLEINSHFGDQ